MHGDTAQLPVRVGAAGGGKYFIRIRILFLPDAEHVLLVAVKIALSESLAGKGALQQLHLLGGGAAALLYGLGIYPGDDAGIFGPLHAPFYLHAGDPRLFYLLKPGGKAVVLQGEGVIVHTAAQTVLHTAGLGAHAPVAAAPAYEAGHVALAAVAEAQGPVDKYLRLDGGVGGDELNLLQAQLSCQDRPCKPHFRRRFHTRQIMQAHLRAGMNGNIRQGLSDGFDQAQILHNKPVRPQGGSKPGRGHGAFHLPVAYEGVQRHIHPAAPDAAVTQGLFEFFVCKIFRAPAGVEIPHAHINGVRPVLDGGNHGFGGAGR